MKLIQKLNWLIEQYIRNIDLLEEDAKDDNSTFNTYRKVKMGVYKEVVNDLQLLLEGEDKWK